MNKDIREAIKVHRKNVEMGMDINAELATVTEKIELLTVLYTARAYSAEFNAAIMEERLRLQVESSAMHAVIREMKG
jgi:hypothetical protein